MKTKILYAVGVIGLLLLAGGGYTAYRNFLVSSYTANGTDFMKRDDYPNAIAAFSKALRFVPNDEKLLRKRCVCYALSEADDLAIEDCSRAIELKKTEKAYSARATAYFRKGEYLNTIKDCSAALKIDPSGIMYVLRGQALEHYGRPDLALKDYTSALQLEPGMMSALSARGGLYLRFGQTDKAQADLALVRNAP